jgi:prevent-host-death family protein
MQTIGVARLKAHLSRYLAHVKGGQEVLVTERGRPVAKLVPLPPAAGRESRRKRLIRAGILLPGTGRIPAALLRAPRGPRVGDAVVKLLLAERREGR